MRAAASMLQLHPSSSRRSSRSRSPWLLITLVAAAFLLFRSQTSSSSNHDGSMIADNDALHLHSNDQAASATHEYAARRAELQRQGRARLESEDEVAPQDYAGSLYRGGVKAARSLADMLALRRQARHKHGSDRSGAQIVWKDPVGSGDDGYSTDSPDQGDVEDDEEGDDSKQDDPFGYGKAGLAHHFSEEDRAPDGLKLSELEEKYAQLEEPVRLCRSCQCDKAGSYTESKESRLKIPTVEELRSVISKTRSLHEPALLKYLAHTISLRSVLEGTFLNDQAIAELLTNHYTCPDSVMAFNFEGLKLDKPTSYIYTRTGPGGKLADWKERSKYLTRQAKMINSYLDLVGREGFLDGKKGGDRQLVWIVVEDESMMEGKLELLLRESKIPFLYLAHGPTNRFGKAQWNVVMKAIHVLRDGFFGDGPVYNLDDDSRVLPELLQKMWKVEKAIVWQVGNYPCLKFDSWWEGPVYENGKLKKWHYAWMPDRVFPIDLNGFAVNSSQIGEGRPINPPKYIPFDQKAGETEFLEKIYSSKEEIEPLCDDTVKEKCFYTWHNSWIKPGWKDHGSESTK